MQIRRFPDLDALSRAAAEDFVSIALESVRDRGVFHVALAGGSTPKKLFGDLVARGKAALPWDKITLWWGDERTVAADHPDSNYGMTKKFLIDPLGLDAARIHPIDGANPAHASSAGAYERLILDTLGTPPVFDLVLLGMGPDGHTASLFPHTPALGETKRWVTANELTAANLPGACTRITFTARAINAARHIRFTAGGADKAKSLVAVLEGPSNPETYPSQLIAPSAGDLVWLVDEAAAKELTK